VPHPRGGAANREAGVRAALAVLEQRGTRQEGQQGGLGTAVGRWGDAWKENPSRSWRWSSGYCAGGERRWQSEAEGEAAVAEEEEAGRCQQDLFTNLEISRDSSVKKEFPLIQNPSEENV
jgi:hypothetical protein